MTATKGPPGLADTPRRRADLVLARAHLRLGSLALARAELEILAGAGELDGPGRVDLAEVRWRTGDLARAGEAATEALTAMGDEPIALVVAAEAAAALGRPNEARRLATRAMDRIGDPIDGVFAGMPRSAVWPADAAEPPPTAGTLFQPDAIPAQARRAGDSDTLAASTLRGSVSEPASEPSNAGPASRAPVTRGFWDVEAGVEPVGAALPDPTEELEAAARALVAGALEEAALRFALTLRLAPALAPAVLEATDAVAGAGTAGSIGPAGPGLSVVRGDAFRLVGLEIEARRAYAMAAWSGSRDRRHVDTPEPEAPPVSDTIRPVPRTRTQGRHDRH